MSALPGSVKRPASVTAAPSEALRSSPASAVGGRLETVAYWISRYVRLREGQRFSLSGTSCTMGIPAVT